MMCCQMPSRFWTCTVYVPTVRSAILQKSWDFSQLPQPLALVIKSQYADLECLDIYIKDSFICPLGWKTLVFLCPERKYFQLKKKKIPILRAKISAYNWKWLIFCQGLNSKENCLQKCFAIFVSIALHSEQSIFLCVLKLHSEVVKNKKKSDACINYNLIKMAAQICHPPHYNLSFSPS